MKIESEKPVRRIIQIRFGRSVFSSSVLNQITNRQMSDEVQRGGTKEFCTIKQK